MRDVQYVSFMYSFLCLVLAVFSFHHRNDEFYKTVGLFKSARLPILVCLSIGFFLMGVFGD